MLVIISEKHVSQYIKKVIITIIIIIITIITIIIIIIIAIESHGAFRKSALEILHELGLHTPTVTLDPRETSFLFQHLFIAIQGFNVVCFTNTCYQLAANFFKFFVVNAHPVTNAFISVQWLLLKLYLVLFVCDNLFS